MKKVYLFIGLMLSALAVGCNNSNVDGTEPTPGVDNKVVVTVNATLPGDLTWVSGDKVAINGLESEAVSEAGAGAVSYAFETSKIEAPVVVVAPYKVLSGANEVTFPATQSFVADGFDREAYAMAGFAPELTPAAEDDDNNLVADVVLSPFVGVVSLPLTLDPATAEAAVLVKSISFTALGDAALNGTWSAEPTTSTDEEGVVSYDVKLTAVSVASSTNLNCGDGVELNTDAPVYFNLVVPAGVYTGGFEVVVTDTENHNFILNLTEDVAVERGATIELAPSVFTVVEKAPATLSVTIGEQGITWNEGDAVVCNNTLSTTTVSASAAGSQTATFDFEAVAYPYSVFYPAEYYTTSGSLRFYEEQEIAKNTVNHSLMVMAGYSTTTDVTLTNLCGIVSVPITNKYEGETIVLDKVEVATSEGDPIAGKYHINYRTGALTSVAGKSALTLKPNEDEFTIAPEETVTLNFVVPKGAIRNGLILNLHSSVGVVENYKIFPTGVTVRGGETATADAYIYQEIKIDAIRTAEELLDFAKCVNIGRYKKFINEEGKVVLGGDIDMSTLTEWVPVTGVVDEATGIPMGFAGQFDGKGFSIKNWNTTQPLFGYVAVGGSVSNLIVDQSCGLVIPARHPYTLDGKASSNLCFGFVVASNAGVVENVVNNAEVTCSCPDDSAAQARAAIVGFNAIGGYVRGCINNAPVTYELGTHNSQTGYLGTVVGRSQSAAEAVPAGIYNCENHGAFTINILDVNSTKNFYVGGVTGSSNSYTCTIGCKNTGKITWNTPYSGALLAIGGITSYSAGEIRDCVNEGDILLNNTGNIKGAIIAGITPYQNGPISNCTNKGNITAYGKTFEGRNTIGSIDTTKAKSSPAPTFAGIVGFGYNSSGSPFSIDNCHNYGDVTYIWTEADGSGTSGRTQVAGIIGAPWGDVTNCNNYGNLTFTAKYASATANHLSYIGGIAGSDYYALSQSESSIINCVNEGNITIDCDLGTSNNAAGGIIGWPGAESNCTNVTENCINRGNIIISGEGKFRLGGIQGGSGIIKGCTNEGNITINSANSGSAFGGLAGFHSGGYQLINSTNTGDIVCNVPLPYTEDANGANASGGLGGMVGCLGNSAHAEGKIAGNTIKCLVKANADTESVGYLVGHFNGKTQTIYVGSADAPIIVSGSLQIGDTTTVIDATNITSSTIAGSTCRNFDSTKHLFNCVLAQ